MKPRNLIVLLISSFIIICVSTYYYCFYQQIISPILIYFPIIAIAILLEKKGLYIATIMALCITLFNIIKFDLQLLLNDLLIIIIILFITHKISISNKSRQTLTKDKDKYKTLFENAERNIIIYEPYNNGYDFIILDINKAAKKSINKNKQEVIGQNVSTAIPYVKESGLFDVLQRVCKTNVPESFNIHKFKNNTTSLYIRHYIYKLSSGEIVAISSDETDRVIKEEIEKRLTTAIEQAGESVFITDREGIILYVNPAFEKITGYSKKEIIGKNHCILKSEQYNSDFYKIVLKNLIKGQIAWKGRIVNRRKDNKLIETETTISPVRGREGQILNYISIKRDVTEEMELRKQLQHAQKMEALGTLAGGIAHDFNNILFPLICYAEICMDDVLPGTVVYKNLDAMLQGLNRAKDLVDQILIFSRQSEEELKPLQVNLIIKEALKLIRPSIPSNIKIESHIKNDCAPVLANVIQIHQVIMNLCSNAVHAMHEKGGTLTICMHEIDDGCNEFQLIPNQSAKSYLIIKVKDTGHGMEQSVMDRIFDPYFTTKAPNQGTGLGLAVVHGIIKKQNGHISVSSTIGKGSTFTIYLPQISANKIKENDKIEKQEQSLSIEKNIKILLVDDEHNIVNMVTLMLERKGYKVMSETNSLRAFEIFKKQYNDIDLVITDQIMPNITGLQLSKKIKQIRPDIPIIIITGNKNFVKDHKNSKTDITLYLQKPVNTSIILQAINKVLSN